MKALRIGLGLVLGASLLTACAPTQSDKEKQAFEQFKSEVKAMQSSLPQAVDSTLSIDAITIDGKTVNYKYTFQTNERLDPAVLRNMSDVAKKAAEDTMCTPNTPVKLALDYGLIVNYYYHYSDGREAAVVTITKDTCD